jgi:AbrB family looped-hinge helix DNA binding protein
MSIATLSSKYQISIPKDVREALDLRPGQRIAFLRSGSTLKLVPVPDIEDLFGIARGADTGHYRDRSSGREDGLPVLTEAQKTALHKKFAKAKARSKSGA